MADERVCDGWGGGGGLKSLFFVVVVALEFLFLFYAYEYTVTVFRHAGRGHQIPLQMVVSHHVVAGI